MPSTSIRTYSDPQQLEAAHIAAEVELTPTEGGPFEARVVHLELGSLWVHSVDELAPRIKWAAQSPLRTFFRFLTKHEGNLVIDGVKLQTNEIVRFCNGLEYFEQSSGPTHWANVSLPVEDAAEAGLAIASRHLRTPRSPIHIVPLDDAMTRLRRLHAEIATLIEATPQTIQIPEVAHGLQQSLVGTLVECLNDGEAQESTWAHQCHDTIMQRFRRILEANPDQALYVPEICSSIKVPERTLRLCCQERLGMSPKNYLHLRRLHLAQRALSAARPGKATVTEIATRFGFWHFGRFAGCYRLRFGEHPSATLHRQHT